MVDALPGSIKDLRDEEPWDFYETRRAQGQVVWDVPAKAWLVLGYDEAAYVERNEGIFAETTAALPGADRLTHPREFRLLNGEPHRVLHKFLSQLWAPSAFEQYRTPVVRRIIDERIANFRHRGEAELWSDFASIVPIAVVAELIGLPSDDDEQLRACKDWTEAVLLWRHTYGEDRAVVDAAADASGRLDPFIGPIISARRERPTGDLISRLWEVGPTIFPDWGEEDILANVKPLFEAGSDTSSNLICSVLYAVLTDESIRTAVRNGGEPLIRLIEETLRLRTVVHWRARVAMRDVELGGVSIRAGDRVHPVNAAANRDPRRYDHPDQMDLGRKGYFSHLAFNVGPRQCAGSPIARMEAYESVLAMLGSLPDLRLDTSQEPPRYLGYVVRSYRPLHVLFTA
ncbi:MAG: cytochrome P450 [Chloroflexota bacterium]|nr:cytochrome P450 [Chloroflexota bacterium]MDQ3689179.1 cytochrome P450 [Chloroflexota bacterium]